MRSDLELPGALQSTGLDPVAYDASLRQMAEFAYELRNATPLVIGSEESPPGEGYPYDLVFKGFQDKVDFLLKIVVRDMRSYEQLVRERLSKIKGVGQIRTSFVLATPKYSTQVPL